MWESKAEDWYLFVHLVISQMAKGAFKHLNKIQRENVKIQAMPSANLIQGHSLSCLPGPRTVKPEVGLCRRAVTHRGQHRATLHQPINAVREEAHSAWPILIFSREAGNPDFFCV